MTSIVSMLSGGSAALSRPLAVLGKGGVKRLRAGFDSQFALADSTGANADFLVKRVGDNLHVAESVQGAEYEVLIVDGFFGSNSQLFSLDTDGKCQPFVVLTDVGGVEVSEMVERDSVLRRLVVHGPVLAADARVLPDLVPVVAAVAPRTVQPVVPANAAADAEEHVAPASSHVMSAPAPDHDASVLAAVACSSGQPAAWGGAELPDMLPEQSETPAMVDTTAVVPVETSSAKTDSINEDRGNAIVAALVEVDAAGAVVVEGADTAPVIDAMWDDHGAVTGVIQNGGVTDDGRPKIMGKAEPGVIVHVYDGIELIGHTVADANGEWSFIPRYPMADGQHIVSIVHEYPNGDVSEDSAPYIIIVDKVVPDIPVITGMKDDEGRITGQIAAGSATDDNRPTVEGEAEPYSTVIIYDKGNRIGWVPVDGGGKWSYTPDIPLADGLHILEYAAVDRAGNLSEKSPPTEFLIDTRPELVEIYAADDDVGVVTGAFMSGGVTDDTQPRLFGTATAGGTVKIYEGVVLLGQATAGADGKWEFTPPLALSEGMHSLSATVSTEAKGESGHSPTFDLIIDTSAPDKPTIEQVYDDVGEPRGPLAQGQSTDDTTPTLSGKAEAGSTVRIYDHGDLLGTTLADASGRWNYTVTPALDDGEHLFSVTAQDRAGSVSDASDGFAIVIDTAPPAPPVIELVYDDQGGQTGYLNSGDITDDSKPTISGSAEAFAKVVIRDHGLEIGYAMANADGKWTFEPFLPMGLGLHKLTAEAIDAAGNISAPSDRFDLTLGSPDLPAVPTITSVVDDVGAVTGNLQKNDVTDDTRPTINGTAQAGMTISVYVDGSLAGSTLVAANGEWSYTLGVELVDGLHKITAKAINSVGNASDPTGEYPIIVDTTPPVAPVETDAVLWDDAGTITGVITSGTITDDNTPTFNGVAEPNATVVIYDDGEEIGRAPVNASGVWSFTPLPVLVDGVHKLSYEVMDKAGNISPKSEMIEFTVDTSKLQVSIDGANDDVGKITGAISKGGVTDDTTPTLHGKATPGGIVKIYEGDVLLGQATAGSDGQWSMTVTEAMGGGAHSLVATVTTVAHGESDPSDAFDFNIDVTAPDTPTIVEVKDDVGFPQNALSKGESTDDTTPTLSGKAEAGSTVHVYDKDSLLGSVVAGESGDWSFTPSPPLLNGVHEFTVKAEDKAGNVSQPSDMFDIIIDTVAPEKPLIDSVYDDQGARTGDVLAGASTDDARPRISGRAEAGSTVIIKDGDVELGRVLAGSDGKWVFDPPAALSEGAHALSVEAMDAAGNVSVPSDEFGFTVDTSLPTTPKILNITDDVGSFKGLIKSGGSTDDARPTINGNGKAGEAIEIYLDGVLLGTTVVGSNGRWAFTPELAIADGYYGLTALAVSAGGAESVVSNLFQVNVDTVAPDRPVVEDVHDNAGSWTGSLQNGAVTDDRTPTFKGKAEPGTTILVFDNDDEIGFASVAADGSWSYTTEVLGFGEHRITFHSVDVAANLSPPSEAWVLVVTMPSRALAAEAVAETTLSIGDLLLDGQVGMFVEDAGKRDVAACGVPIDNQHADGDVSVQESWQARTNQMEVRADWPAPGMIDANQMLELQFG